MSASILIPFKGTEIEAWSKGLGDVALYWVINSDKTDGPSRHSSIDGFNITAAAGLE